MENTEVWERIHFTQSPYVLFLVCLAPSNLYSTVPSVSLVFLQHWTVDMSRLNWAAAGQSLWTGHHLVLHAEYGRAAEFVFPAMLGVCVCWLYAPCKVFSASLNTHVIEQLASRQCQTKELNQSSTSPKVQRTSGVGACVCVCVGQQMWLFA